MLWEEVFIIEICALFDNMRDADHSIRETPKNAVALSFRFDWIKYIESIEVLYHIHSTKRKL